MYISDDYICRNNGSYLSFETGSITVTWHIGNSTVTDTYIASKVATFKNYSDLIGKLTYTRTETENGVVYGFFTTGWAKEAGGVPISSADMVVSEDNCEFWLVNNVPVECLFVTIDTSGNVTMYNTESELRSLISNNGKYDIVLCRDVELLNTNILSLAKEGHTLYLNGHTLSHKQYNEHLFIYKTGATANFYFIGPGTIESENARSVFTSDSSTADKTSSFGIVAEHVNFVTNTQLADLRIGQHMFIDCSIKQSGSSKVLIALWNKNPNFLSNGSAENILSITFDSCNIDVGLGLISYSSGTYSEVYLIDTFVSADNYLFESTTTSLKFNVSGNSSIIASSFAKDTTKNYKSVVFNVGLVTNLEIPSKFLSNSPTQAVLTNNYDAALPYRVSNTYAKVTWKDADGNVLATEYVAVGVTPKLTNPAVVDYLKSKGAGYVYQLPTVSGTEEIVLTPVLKASVPVLMSMTIEQDLTMYLYIEKAEMDKIAVVSVGGIRIMTSSYEIVEIDGVEYYRYSILSFNPTHASNKINIRIEYRDGQVTNLSTSAIDYLEELLAISKSDEEKTLIVKLLKYIHSAQLYSGSTSQFEQSRILGIVDEYKEYDLIYGNISKDSAATSALRDAIRSASFELSASVKIRFYLNSGYTGKISVTLNGVTLDYSVENGTVNDKGYIDIILLATEINDTLVLSDGVNTVNYGLNAYYTAINNTDYKVINLLSCMSEYSSAAKVYVGG